MDKKVWEELIKISNEEIKSELLESLADDEIEEIFKKYSNKYDKTFKELS